MELRSCGVHCLWYAAGEIEMEKSEALEQERDIGTVEKEMMKLNMLLYKKRGLHHELEQSNSLMESDFIGSLKVRPLHCLSVSGGGGPSYQIQKHLYIYVLLFPTKFGINSS